MEKICVKKRIYTLFYDATYSRIIGICEGKKLHFLQNTPRKQRQQVVNYAYENCLIHNKIPVKLNRLKGELGIRHTLNEIYLIFKGSTIVGVYQRGVDFMDYLPDKVKKEALANLYQYNYIDANTYGKLVSKFHLNF